MPGNLAAVKDLMRHPAFNINNPNSCYSLFLGFARSPVNFHAGERRSGVPVRGGLRVPRDRRGAVQQRLAAAMPSTLVQRVLR